MVENLGADFGGQSEQRRGEGAGGEFEEEFEFAEELALAVFIHFCYAADGQHREVFALDFGHVILRV
jgi:hypothetical protein